MKVLGAALVAAVMVGGLAGQAEAAAKKTNEDCVVTGWTDWVHTRPIFKCPDPDGDR